MLVLVVIGGISVLLLLVLIKLLRRVGGDTGDITSSAWPEDVSKGEDVSKRVISRTEVARHCTPEDTWLILEDRRDGGVLKVYDVSDYIDLHPGGMAIMRNAVEDSTSGFYGPQHPLAAFDLVDDFCIGLLESQTEIHSKEQ